MKKYLQSNAGISQNLLLLITFSTAFSVANIYYSQPLLAMIREEFSISEVMANGITMTAQIGYALGLLFIVPLGDMMDRRKIIITNFSIITLALLVIAYSANIYSVLVASFITGICSVTPQIFLPLVSQFSTPQNKGKNIGIVISGLLIGILSSRVVSGLIGELYGWRTMYYIAAAIMFLFLLLIYLYFPLTQPNFIGKYSELMKSLFTLIKEEPKLMFAASKSGLAFGSFLSLWAMLAFKMAQAPFYAGGTIVGFLGLCGVAGAFAASFLGKHVQFIGLFRINFIGGAFMLIGWVSLYIWQDSYIGIITGIIILDIGMQCIQLGNQTSIFELRPQAINRLNTIFMTCYFIGGATGTLLTGLAWKHLQWTGVVSVGIGLILISILINIHQALFKRNL